MQQPQEAKGFLPGHRVRLCQRFATLRPGICGEVRQVYHTRGYLYDVQFDGQPGALIVPGAYVEAELCPTSRVQP